MNLIETIKNINSRDYRRVASGTLCRIIYDPSIVSFNEETIWAFKEDEWMKGLLDLLYRFSAIPSHVLVDKSTGIDRVTGTSFVIPKGAIPDLREIFTKYKQNIDSILSRYSIDNNKENNIAVITELKTSKSIVETLGDYIILVNIDYLKWGELVTGVSHEVYVYTQDMAAPYAEPVRRIPPLEAQMS